MKFLARTFVALCVLGVLAWAGFVGLSYGFAQVHRDASPLPEVQAIIVISGPGAEDEIAIGDTAERVTKGAELWEAGRAPYVVMSGSGAYEGQTALPDSIGMRRLGEQLGLPPNAILEEDRSFSTLQNAIFTAELPEIDPAAPIILVTNRYHLLRAWLSFKWAGFDEVIPVAADNLPSGSRRMYFMEGLKWGFNVARAAGASTALTLGVPETDVWPYLE